MSQIQISNLTFGYDGSYDNIFEDANIQLDTDWRLGFVGRNGRGKTTLLNLLMGRYEYSGTISASVDFDYFPFPVNAPERDAWEVAEEVAPTAEQWEVLRELSLLEVPEEALYRPFSSLSQGEQTKLLLAALFLREDTFFLIDEPTNHLDMAARENLACYLRRKKGFILVSHDRAFLDNCVDHILSINRADIEVQQGNYSSWQHNRRLRDSFELAENEKLKQEVKKLTAAARRTSGWSDQMEKTKYGTRNSGLRPDRGFIGHKSAKMMQRSKAIEQRQQRALEEKEGLLKNLERSDSLAIHPLDYHKDCLLELEDVTVSYGGPAVLEGFSLTLRRGERVALQGRNGSGKSSILGLIQGKDIPHTGQVRLGSGLLLSVVSQDTSWLRGDLREHARHMEIDESLFKAILRKLDFSRAQFDKDMADFSGGQKKKVLLATSLCQRAHLYLWDEPLNFIDVLSRIQIEELLLEHRPTMLFVEHDSAFVETVATRRVHLA